MSDSNSKQASSILAAHESTRIKGPQAPAKRTRKKTMRRPSLFSTHPSSLDDRHENRATAVIALAKEHAQEQNDKYNASTIEQMIQPVYA